MDLKPMLAAKIKTEQDFAGIVFPVLASPKLDGIRATIQGPVLSRTLKKIPNKKIQAALGESTLNWLDGELILGDPTAEDVFSSTTSVVMSDDKPVDGLVYHVFDRIGAGMFKDRLDMVKRRVDMIDQFGSTVQVRLVPHQYIHSQSQLLDYESQMLDKGYEGIMIRDPEGFYKNGRSTLKGRGLAAIKRFTDAEAVVVDTYEQEENTNEKVTNELGRSKRSSAQAGKVGKGTLGGFTVVANPEDADAFEVFGTTPFNIGTGLGLTQILRQELWNNREAQVGRIIKFKYQAIGVKDKPRLPIWLGFRDRMDM